jgi:hypothetical protein
MLQYPTALDQSHAHFWIGLVPRSCARSLNMGCLKCCALFSFVVLNSILLAMFFIQGTKQPVPLPKFFQTPIQSTWRASESVFRSTSSPY